LLFLVEVPIFRTVEDIKEPDIAYDKVYTYADYLQFDFDYMVELIRGKIFKMTPAPNRRHQSISLNLSISLGTYFKTKPCQVYAAPIDVILPIADRKRDKSHTVVQPDLCIVCNQDLLKDPNAVFGPPTLIVEILSPHTKKKDIQLKYDIYEEAGVQEYWVIMPEEELLEQFVLENGKYQRIQTYTKEDSIKAQVLEGLSINLEEVFAD